ASSLAPRRGFCMLRRGSGRLYFELQVVWPRLGIELDAWAWALSTLRRTWDAWALMSMPRRGWLNPGLLLWTPRLESPRLGMGDLAECSKFLLSCSSSFLSPFFL
ncbi:hypothetical protein PIB30_095655, partial [Stylosanthes scabra]|nr:hypothetical protein [Stylosanthes scabra]